MPDNDFSSIIPAGYFFFPYKQILHESKYIEVGAVSTNKGQNALKFNSTSIFFFYSIVFSSKLV